MTTFTVDVSEAVRKLDPKNIEHALEQGIADVAGTLQSDMQQYPPPPPASTYMRTGKLGRSWTRKITKNPTGAIIGSQGVGYARYVQDHDYQAAIHRGRWQTTEMIARKRLHDIKASIERALARWAR